jgi:hypothetical protein
MALDALWSVELEARGRSTNGGVIILQSGHILGGSNTHYYIGTFMTGGTKLQGHVRIAWYSGSRQTAWGDEAEVVEAKVSGESGGPNTITGKVSRSGHPDISFRMAKQAELP